MSEPTPFRADDPRTFPLRCAVAAVGLLGFGALVGGGLLSFATAALAGAAYLAASCAPIALPDHRQLALRKAASVCVLLIVAAASALRAMSGFADGVVVLGIGTTLAALVAGLQVAHALLLDTRRDLAVGLTIGVFTIVLAAGLGPGPGIALPLLLAWPVAVLAVMLAYRLDQLESVAATARALSGGPTGHGQRMAAGTIAAAVVVGVVVFLVLPTPPGIHPHPLGGGGLQSLGSADSESVPVSRSALYYSSGVLDLRARGTLGDQPVAVVPDSSPALWAGTVLSNYDGETWSNDQSEPVRLPGGPTYAIPHPLYPLVTGSPRADTVHTESGFTGVVIAPGAIDAVTTAGQVALGSGGAVDVSSQTDGEPESYSVSSVPPVVDPAKLQAAAGPDLSDPEWTQLPAELPIRVRALAGQLTNAASSRYAAVEAVATYLRTHETYELNSPVPAPGADAVDDFLFVSHTGFCEQFASAEVVLLRAVGIPARLVTGFGNGSPDGPGRRLFRVSDAHAWVEVWYPGIGWSPSDPTAGAALAQGSGSASDVVENFVRDLSGVGSRALLAGGLLILVGAGAALVRRRRSGRSRRGGAAGQQGGPNPGVLQVAFARLESALAAVGAPRGPAESINELGRRLSMLPGARDPGGVGDPGSAGPRIAGPGFALETLERALYAAEPPGAHDEVQAAAALDRLTGAVLGPAQAEH